MNPIMKFFNYAHLPVHLQEVSKPFGDLAAQMHALLPEGAEKSAGLRKLLEAKDCFVRAHIEGKDAALENARANGHPLSAKGGV